MPKNTRPSRKMKPVILVLCEGETEECVNMLKKENPWKDYKKGKLSFEHCGKTAFLPKTT